jgi:hypothetical protein
LFSSKGEKVEVLWNAQAYEDLALLNVGFAPVLENVDYHWEIFLWGDPPIKAQSDIDLGVPNTWFEYELEWWNEHSIIEDQVTIKSIYKQKFINCLLFYVFLFYFILIYFILFGV